MQDDLEEARRRRERLRSDSLPLAAPRSGDDDDDVDRGRGKEYWETGDADKMVVEGGGVTLDDASTEWLVRAGLIAVAVLIVAGMMMQSIPGG
ncbi:MAG: hypothetical protein H7338_00935 [Candidatus Sericytochromatia bacterium]|nr:hypothetical protein [Candidatus Sericytochromatia bacterium]